MQANSAFVKVMLALALALAAGHSVAQTKDNAVTLYAAYRDGGSFTDVNSGNKLPIAASGAASVSLDLKLDTRRHLHLFLSRQNSQMSTGQAIAPTPPGGPTTTSSGTARSTPPRRCWTFRKTSGPAWSPRPA